MSDNEQIQTYVKSVMEDPSAQAVARVYADAFLNAAGAEAEGTLEEFSSFLDDVLPRNAQFANLLFEGVLNRDRTVELLDRVFAAQGSELFKSFMKTLARHGRLNLLPLILEESQVKYELQCGKQRVTVTSAIPLSTEMAARVQSQLDEALPFTPIINSKIDESLLGGLLIQVGDTVYDT